MKSIASGIAVFMLTMGMGTAFFWAAASLGIGHFVWKYSPNPIICTQGPKP